MAFCGCSDERRSRISFDAGFDEDIILISFRREAGSASWRCGIVANLSGRGWIMKRKPVIPPPAVHATNGPQRKHGKQAIERAQLSRLEFPRVAAGTFVLQPNQMR